MYSGRETENIKNLLRPGLFSNPTVLMGYSHPEHHRHAKTPPPRNDPSLQIFNQNESSPYSKNFQMNRSASFGHEDEEESFERELPAHPIDTEEMEAAAQYSQYQGRAPLIDCTNRSHASNNQPSFLRATTSSSKRTAATKENLERSASQSKLKSTPNHQKSYTKTLEKTPSSRKVLQYTPSHDQENNDSYIEQKSTRTSEPSTRRLNRSPSFATPVSAQALEIQKLEKELDALKRLNKVLKQQRDQETANNSVLTNEIGNLNAMIASDREKYQEELLKITNQIKKLRGVQNAFVNEKKNVEHLENQLHEKDQKILQLTNYIKDTLKLFVGNLKNCLTLADIRQEPEVYENVPAPLHEKVLKSINATRKTLLGRLESAEALGIDYDFKENEYKELIFNVREQIKAFKERIEFKGNINQHFPEKIEQPPRVNRKLFNSKSFCKIDESTHHGKAEKYSPQCSLRKSASEFKETKVNSTVSDSSAGYHPLNYRLSQVQLNFALTQETNGKETKPSQLDAIPEKEDKTEINLPFLKPSDDNSKSLNSDATETYKPESSYPSQESLNSAENKQVTDNQKATVSKYPYPFSNNPNQKPQDAIVITSEKNPEETANLQTENAKSERKSAWLEKDKQNLTPTKTGEELQSLKMRFLQRKQSIEARRSQNQSFDGPPPELLEPKKDPPAEEPRATKKADQLKPSFVDTLIKGATLPKAGNKKPVEEAKERVPEKPSSESTFSSAETSQCDDGPPEMVIARFDYTAQKESDISFKKGETIKVLKKSQNGWWIGICGNKVGYFPFNFVTQATADSK